MARTETNEKPFKVTSHRDGWLGAYMGVPIAICHANQHIPGVCSHPGSKADLKKRTARRRAKNRVARASRRANR